MTGTRILAGGAVALWTLAIVTASALLWGLALGSAFASWYSFNGRPSC